MNAPAHINPVISIRRRRSRFTSARRVTALWAYSIIYNVIGAALL